MSTAEGPNPGRNGIDTERAKDGSIILVFKTFLVVTQLLVAQALNIIAERSVSNREVPGVLIADSFAPPLGYRDDVAYGPKLTYDDSGVLIENTDYGIQNPDLKYTSVCLDVEHTQLFHAGEDWYRRDGLDTAGSEVTAIANGVITFADPTIDYPGRVVVIRHILPSSQIIYSIYAHLNSPLDVSAGQTVYDGQKLGTVLPQAYDGRYPQYHPEGYDSHLHFEIRYFADGTHIYEPYCAGSVPGWGYTYPDHPDDFPVTGGYADPNNFLISHELSGFAPLFIPAPLQKFIQNLVLMFY